MNNNIRKLSIEDILFFDIECPRKSETLDVNSKEFELFQRKIRDRDTDELPEEKDTVEKYNKQGGLRMLYNKIVCISVAAVKNNKIYTKSYIGEEKDIIEKFYKKTQEYKYLCGYNIVGYDLPIVQINSMRHGDLLQHLPEKYNVSGKKPWQLPDIIELMDIVKGTHFYNCSLDEVCWHFGIPSPKEDDIDGSQVSDVYYKEGVERIEQYCKKDTVACVWLFNKMQFKPLVDEVIDIDKMGNQDLPEEKLSELQKVMKSGTLNSATVKKLKAIKLTKKEIPVAYEIISAALGKECDTKIW